VPRLTDLKRALDGSIFAALFHKAKEQTDDRLDYFHFNITSNMAVHGEFDKTSTHEDDHNRPKQIAP
jgi:hypothetical protein